jgi:Flp pilus assembly protein TadD
MRLLVVCILSVIAAAQTADIHNERGAALGEKGDIDGALRELETAVRLNPDHAAAQYNLGTTLIRRARQNPPEQNREDLKRALAALRRASKLQPSLPHIHNLLGWLYQEIGDFHSAVEEFREAVRAEPLSPKGHNNLGSALVAAEGFCCRRGCVPARGGT